MAYIHHSSADGCIVRILVSLAGVIEARHGQSALRGRCRTGTEYDGSSDNIFKRQEVYLRMPAPPLIIMLQILGNTSNDLQLGLLKLFLPGLSFHIFRGGNNCIDVKCSAEASFAIK